MSSPVHLKSGRLSLELAPEVGGAIAGFRRLTSGGAQPLLRESPPGMNDPLEAAAFPLVPFCNRIRDGRFRFRGEEIILPRNMPGQKHPLHGQGWRHPWTVTEASRDRAVLTYRHAPDAWPWAYEARQDFRLRPDGLDWSMAVSNRSDRAMPAGLGLHPYFPCDGRTVLDTRVEHVWTVDQEVMPVQVRPATGRYNLNHRRACGQDLDNGYDGWNGRARMRWPDQDTALEMTSPDAGYFQLYSPREGGLFVAEPVTHANDALSRPEREASRLGIRVLAPGESFGLQARLTVLD